jgi:hypothetical protein
MIWCDKPLPPSPSWGASPDGIVRKTGLSSGRLRREKRLFSGIIAGVVLFGCRAIVVGHFASKTLTRFD